MHVFLSNLGQGRARMVARVRSIQQVLHLETKQLQDPSSYDGLIVGHIIIFWMFEPMSRAFSIMCKIACEI